MSSGPTPLWYLMGPDNQPVGPYSPDQLVQFLWTGQVAAHVPVWREGMPQWLPIGQVEQFASALRSAGAVRGVPAAGVRPAQPQSPRRGILGRLVWTLFWVVFLAGLGVAGYFGVSEWLTVQKASGFIAAKDFQAAIQVLTPFSAKTYLFPNEAPYLLAVATLKEYAAAKDEQGTDKDALDKPRRLLKDAMAAGAVWRERAKLDLADTLDLVPAKAPDAWARAVVLARFLNDMELVDAKQAGNQLLAKTKEVMKEGLGAKSKPPDGKLLGQTLGKDPAMVAALLGAVLADPAGPAPPTDPAISWISRWASDEPSLAGPLAAGLVHSADKYADAGKHQYAGKLLETAMRLQTDPKDREEAVRKRLALVKKQLDATDVKDLAQALEQTLSGWPRAAEAGELYLDAAKRLRETDASGARRALDEALRLSAKLQESEAVALLWLALNPQPGEERLRRCQALLKRSPTSAARAEVLLSLVSDAIILSQQAGWSRQTGAPYLDAAETLLKDFSTTPELDAKVFALLQQLAKIKQNQSARSLASAILENLPGTPLKQQVEETIASLREKDDGGRIPSRLAPLAERVDKELKIFPLRDPAGVRALAANPKAFHVVQVDDGLSHVRFTTDEAETLRQWVRQGGILWVRNDVLSLFDIHYGGGHGQNDCDRSVTEDVCPILTGCHKARLHIGWGHAVGLACSSATVIPLWSSGATAAWSLVRYGEGWIINVHSVDLTTYDGARFWLNFRLFCMGQPIPEAKTQRIVWETASGPKTPSLMPIATVPDLEKALAEIEKQRVMWIQLPREAVSEEQLEKVRKWVADGGVLWLDTDLANALGFKLKALPNGQTQGKLPVTDASHPILEGLAPNTPVTITLAPGALLLQTTVADLAKEGLIPLLGEVIVPAKISKVKSPAGARTIRVNVVCAVRNEGRGVVIYRPRTISETEGGGKQFVDNLRRWSLQIARPETPKASAPAKQTSPDTAVPPGAVPREPAKP